MWTQLSKALWGTTLAWFGASAVAAQTLAATVALSGDALCSADAQSEIRRRFPSDQFIVGSGVAGLVRDKADGLVRARQAAMAQISKQLETRIESIVELSSSQNAARASRSATLHSKESTSAVLKNVHYELECFRPGARETETWAVLNKADAVRGANEELAQLNDRGSKLHASARERLGSGKVRDALQILLDIRALALEAKENLKILRALGAGAPAAFLDDAGLHELERDSLDRSAIYVDISAGSSSEKSAIEAELTRRKLPVASHGRAAVFRVSGRVTQVSAQYSKLSGAAVVELRADVAIGYVGHSESLASLQVREKGTGADERAAAIAADKRLAASLSQGVAKEFDKLLGTDDRR